MLKTVGYLISTVSVLLLGIVAWKATETDATLRLCLLTGMAASIVGMFCRWLSYEIEKRADAAARSAGRGHADRHREAHGRAPTAAALEP